MHHYLNAGVAEDGVETAGDIFWMLANGSGSQGTGCCYGGTNRIWASWRAAGQ